MDLTKKQINKLKFFQKNEITEYRIYKRLARRVRADNVKVLSEIADEELKHYNFWKEYSGEEIKPNPWRVFIFHWITRLMGLTFGIKLMERGEQGAQELYQEATQYIPEAQSIVKEEDEHEHKLIAMLKEKKLNYVGSIVLGLNDALVELTGALAGFTLAMQNTQLIAIAGLITGIAASFSMGASEYLSQRSDEESSHALTSALYTGSAYLITVFILILPFLLAANYFIALAFTLVFALLIIMGFNYYIAVAKDLPFKKRFAEMALLSIGVAVFTFGISYLVRIAFGVEV